MTHEEKPEAHIEARVETVEDPKDHEIMFGVNVTNPDTGDVETITIDIRGHSEIRMALQALYQMGQPSALLRIAQKIYREVEIHNAQEGLDEELAKLLPEDPDTK